MRKIGIAAALLAGWLMSATAAETVIDGYTFSAVSVRELPTDNPYMKKIEFSARISGGAPCKRLELSIWLINEHGDKCSLSATVKDAGGSGSRMVSAVDKAYFAKSNQRWRLDTIYPNCRD